VGGVREQSMQLDNLRFVFYTNEHNLHLIELTLSYFFKHVNLTNPKVSVIANRLPDRPLPFSDKVSYLSGNVDFHYNGQHFAKTFLNTLPQITEKYIFFFCDDYFLVADLQSEHLNKTIELLDKHNVDYFGFDEIISHLIPTFPVFSENLAEYPDVKLLVRDNSYRYLFSVQPSIWNVQSMLNLLKNRDNISLHNLDETLSEIKETNMLLALGHTGMSHFSYNDEEYHVKDITKYPYFIIAYLEISRHGVFHMPENGFHLSQNYSCVKFIRTLIDEFQLKHNPEFKKLLHNL
jgi:hypothetical protein